MIVLFSQSFQCFFYIEHNLTYNLKLSNNQNMEINYLQVFFLSRNIQCYIHNHESDLNYIINTNKIIKTCIYIIRNFYEDMMLKLSEIRHEKTQEGQFKELDIQNILIKETKFFQIIFQFKRKDERLHQANQYNSMMIYRMKLFKYRQFGAQNTSNVIAKIIELVKIKGDQSDYIQNRNC
ncbi:hypothetical protein pb186bvf_011474 [Paramecium bursaria]